MQSSWFDSKSSHPPHMDAGRKIEFLQATAQGEILRLVPYLLDTLIQHVSNHMALYGSLIFIKIHFVIVHQRQAWAYVAIPTNSQSSLFDKRTSVVAFSQTASGKVQRMVAAHSLINRFTSRWINIHLGKIEKTQ